MSHELAARVAPIVYLDAREPFPPTRVGYSVFESTQPSPSFQRVVEIEPPAVRVVEFAVWCDWDIQHLFELEHVWVYLDASDEVVACEGSWHGFYNAMEWNGVVHKQDGHPIVYAQPGKHAFAPAPEAFDVVRDEAVRACTLDAGRGGLLVTHLYLDHLQKKAADDLLISQYLRRRAFTPTWNFTRRVELTTELLVPWHVLDEYIPPRVEWW
ncbi:MAG: hypothetical protein LC737_03905, partial [Chloroflexi bacterium]|nr:hypothetical protein [Chloroflexota bacterium]